MSTHTDQDSLAGQGADRRRAARASVELVIQYTQLEQFCQDYARNLSLGGIFIETGKPLERGTELRLRFAVPGLSEPLSTVARVVRVIPAEQAGPGSRPGMALQFGQLSDEAKKAIDTLVMQAFLEDSGSEDPEAG